MNKTLEELAKKFKGYNKVLPIEENSENEPHDEIIDPEHICRPYVTYDWDKANKIIEIHFGKNGLGLTDEFTQIGKFIERLSKSAYVYITDAFIDSLDDVYDIRLSYHYKD